MPVTITFIMVNVYQDATPITLILGGLSVYYFSGLFLGVFPKERGVSWQGHLFGLLAGIAANILMTQKYW